MAFEGSKTGLVVALVFVAGVIAAIVYQVVVAPRNRAMLEETLFAPYFAALSDGKVDEAYQRYTTANYKRQYSLDDYRAWHEKLKRESGAVTKRQLATANGFANVGGKKGFIVIYNLWFEKDYAPSLTYNAVKDDDGSYRIDAAATNTASSRTGGSAHPW